MNCMSRRDMWAIRLSSYFWDCRLHYWEVDYRSLLYLGVWAYNEKSINLSNLLAEGLLTVVCEKNDLVWTVPFSVELHAQIVKELLSKFKISDSWKIDKKCCLFEVFRGIFCIFVTWKRYRKTQFLSLRYVLPNENLSLILW